MIALDGTAAQLDIRQEVKELKDSFDNLEAGVFAVLADNYRKQIADLRLKTFRVLQKAEASA